VVVKLRSCYFQIFSSMVQPVLEAPEVLAAAQELLC
jgi:hypothetical protein